ncbi:hypothetical protein BU23DRAFT_482844 [Bimuria novae-zelandiae CBS 107.79]|uniref:Integral membrane protein n=1 Tax=Bimuria novae-zelandiae CBS 107.79 TaxID=1447943 RepID=A0A6A5UTJ3_9PLEO|nr:hypothetical protein BU23DRAFT_482844 [Bimuria novae-zelandiae CBS 107.79]
MELIWVAIYCVKFCYLAQFKFYKPPYAYVNATLTAYYWVAVGCCSVGFVFTIIQPIVLCRMPDKCAYTDGSNTRPWEFAITAIDIVTDVIVVSIPALLIQMTHIVRVETVANFVFKSLSICNIVVAATRLALQYNTKDHRNDRIQYVSVAFLLVVEATVAIVMAAISGYRIVFLRRLAEWRQRKAAKATRLTVRHPTAAGELQAESTKATDQQDGSLSNLPILSNT